MRTAIVHLKKADPALADLIQNVGAYKMEYGDPDFPSLVRSIVYQQLSGKVASVIFGRLLDALPKRRLTPRAILKLEHEQLRGVGLSNQKARYIRDLAGHTHHGTVDFGVLPALSDDDVIQHLTKVKGIGVWTAHMFLMFALRRPDILPTGDLGIRMAMKNLYELPDLPKPAAMIEIAQPWRPYCSVASWYLWRSLDIKK